MVLKHSAVVIYVKRYVFSNKLQYTVPSKLVSMPLIDWQYSPRWEQQRLQARDTKKCVGAHDCRGQQLLGTPLKCVGNKWICCQALSGSELPDDESCVTPMLMSTEVKLDGDPKNSNICGDDARRNTDILDNEWCVPVGQLVRRACGRVVSWNCKGVGPFDRAFYHGNVHCRQTYSSNSCL